MLNMQSPRTVKEIQKLTSCMAAPRKILSNSIQKCLSFFKFLRPTKDFRWTKEAKEAIKQLK